MKIALLGTRGIPNHYGGFEQAAQYLSAGLAQKGHEVTVYNGHRHPYQQPQWQGVQIVHCYEPDFLGTAGQFIYDLNCILDARKKNFDVVLFMGYTSSSVWHRLFPKTVIVSNMDGLEWKREKYSRPVRRFLQYAEKLAIRHSDFFIADSTGIRSYLQQRYGVKATYIPYGALLHSRENDSILSQFGLEAGNYFMLLARMEPENHIDNILAGFCRSRTGKRFVVTGNMENKYGKFIYKKYSTDPRIVFTGPIYHQPAVHSLRRQSALYLHGHSVGGTNPSLLDAMASGALIAAHDNQFNRAVLGAGGFYFSTPEEVSALLQTLPNPAQDKKMRLANRQKIEEQFTWQSVIDQYEEFLYGYCQKTIQNEVAPARFVYK